MKQSKSTSSRLASRAETVFFSSCIMIAIVVYFVVVGAGKHQFGNQDQGDSSLVHQSAHPGQSDPNSIAILATSYADVPKARFGPTAHWTASLAKIPQPAYEMMAEIKPNETDKLQSLTERATRRAYNGAPPIIPHAVEKTNDAACYACHGQGIRIEQRIARKMSHAFLANCTQCHASPPAKPFESIDSNVENRFVGAAAPLAGSRAYPGAPPVIPHSVWMRNECLSCHGGKVGWSGMQSSHPWRSACVQCHALSSVLDQVSVSEAVFLPPIDVSRP